MNWSFFAWAAVALLFGAIFADIFKLLPSFVCIAMVMPGFVVFAVNQWRMRA